MASVSKDGVRPHLLAGECVSESAVSAGSSKGVGGWSLERWGREVWENPHELNKIHRDFQSHESRPRSGSKTNGIQSVSHE